jgi:hypothetical protein
VASITRLLAALGCTKRAFGPRQLLCIMGAHPHMCWGRRPETWMRLGMRHVQARLVLLGAGRLHPFVQDDERAPIAVDRHTERLSDPADGEDIAAARGSGAARGGTLGDERLLDSVAAALVLKCEEKRATELADKLRQVDVLVSQGQNMVDAIRQIGVHINKRSLHQDAQTICQAEEPSLTVVRLARTAALVGGTAIPP